MFLMLLGALLGLVAAATFIWLAVLAFRRHVGWGLAVLFLPFAYIVFAVKHWDEARKPFLMTLGASLASMAFLFVGAALSAQSAMNQMQAEMMNDPQFQKMMQDMQAQMEQGASPASNDAPSPTGSIEALSRRSAPPAPSAASAPVATPSAVELQVGSGLGEEADGSVGDPLDPTISVGQAHRHVGERMRILGPGSRRMTAKLVAMRGRNLVFEQELGAGTVSFEMSPSEIRALELLGR